MGNRSRRRRRSDGSIAAGRGALRSRRIEGSRNDPLYGIPDTNMPHLAGIRIARALAARPTGWRRWYAIVSLTGLIASTFVFLVIAWTRS
ncbi:MAG: hypothetical protein LC789_12920 [Actinobacteria bacterium]|nr:hypothetical protein [Actinomycetota bacterium]MCA1722587.1 hypothetical protein [Actinomycetota bacterium]